jgi:cytoskeletal protein CcmA (bactofilin family)
LSTRRPGSRLSTPIPTEGDGNGQRNSVVLGPKDRLVGQLYIEGDLRVSGTVDGALEATGDIEIAGQGKVSGAVTAYNRLVVGSDASLIGGEVRVARLTVEDGATFTGRVSMGKHQAEVVSEPAPEPQPMPESVPEPEAVTPPQDWGLSTPKRKKGR